MFKKITSLFLLSSLFLTACNQAETEKKDLTEDSSVKVVTTFAPLYSFVSNIVGDQGEVTNLVEPGASVHIWEPSASDLRALSEADLLIINGLELEPFIDDMIDAAQNPNLKVIVTSEAISNQIKESSEPTEIDHEHADEEGDDHDHEHGGLDPHIWLNPKLAIAQVESIQQALMEIDKENEATYQNNGDQYIRELEALDQEIETTLNNVDPKPFIVFHDAYTYYLDRYNLLESRKAAIEPFPGKEPTAAYFQGLVELIENEGVKIVFTEPQFSPQTVQNLQEETGVKSFEINPIGLELSPEGYVNNLRTLTQTFTEAFR